MDANTTNIGRRLYKSRQHKVIDGVCGGIAEYFGVDPTLVRILWILITFLGGSGIILYIVAMIIMPVNHEHVAQATSASPVSTVASNRKQYWGIVLILLGAFIMMSNFGWFADINWWSFSRTVVFPISLILVGALFIYVQSRKQQQPVVAQQSPDVVGQEASSSTAQPVKELRRSITDKKICGVCGGLASYFHIDSTIVRILFIVLILASVGWGILLYIILCILVPEERPTISTTQG